MMLTEPIVGGTTGGTNAIDYGPLLNQNFVILDSHNHTPGEGVQVPPAGININTNLSFQGNDLTNLNALLFNGALIGGGNTLSLYTNGTDLFYEDIHGNSIQLTKAGGPNAGTGNIQGLPSTPTGGAGISWVNGTSTFQFLEDSGTVGANLDGGSFILRYPGSYPTPSGTNWITLEVPSTISTGYSLTLPVALPTAPSFIQISGTGALSSPIPVSGGLTGSNLAPSITIPGSPTIQNSLTVTDDLLLGAATISSNSTIVQMNALQLDMSSGAVMTSDGQYRLLVGNTTGSSYLPAILYNYEASSEDEADAMLYGTISSTGGIFTGTGFTVSHPSAGTYVIHFTQSFSNNPSVVATPSSNSPAVACTEAVSGPSSVTLVFQGIPGAGATDVPFNFIAMGKIN